MAPVADLDIPDDAGVPGLIDQVHIVAARCDAGDPQPLVVLDRSIAIVPALVGTPSVLPRR
jgi:hypothetical protein